MSAPVNVLAVMDNACALLDLHDERRAAELSEARAAVAELLKAARVVAAQRETSIGSEWDRLDDALAKFGGAVNRY